MKEDKLVEVIIIKPNIIFYLLVLVIFFLLSPLIQILSKTIILSIWNIPISDINLTTFFGNSIIIVGFGNYVNLELSQLYILNATELYFLLLFSVFAIIVNKIWYRIFALSALLDVCWISSMILNNDCYKCNIFYDLLFYMKLTVSLVLIIVIIFDLYQVIPIQLKSSDKGENQVMRYYPEVYLFSYKKKLIFLKQKFRS